MKKFLLGVIDFIEAFCKVSKVLIMISMVLVLIWVVGAFVEVGIHNFTMLSESPYQYSDWNFFIKMAELFNCTVV